MDGELKGKIQAWTPVLKREAERVGHARCWIKGKFGLESWTRAQVRISLEELMEIKKRRAIGKTLKDEIILQLQEEIEALKA